MKEIDLFKLLPESRLLINNNKTNIQKQTNFPNILEKALYKLNELHEQKNIQIKRLITGEVENIHDVMIALEISGIATEFAATVRDKLLVAYTELINMGTR